jgi:hypothetical protein
MREAGLYNIVSRFLISRFNSLDRMEVLMALGVQKKRVIRIPTPIEPRRV